MKLWGLVSDRRWGFGGLLSLNVVEVRFLLLNRCFFYIGEVTVQRTKLRLGLRL
jgi:hypothetical protein